MKPLLILLLLLPLTCSALPLSELKGIYKVDVIQSCPICWGVYYPSRRVIEIADMRALVHEISHLLLDGEDWKILSEDEEQATGMLENFIKGKPRRLSEEQREFISKVIRQ